MNQKNNIGLRITAILLPVLFIASWLLLPFVKITEKFNEDEIGSMNVFEGYLISFINKTKSFSFFQLVPHLSTVSLCIYLVPVVLLAIALVAVICSKSKGAYIFEAITGSVAFIIAIVMAVASGSLIKYDIGSILFPKEILDEMDEDALENMGEYISSSIVPYWGLFISIAIAVAIIAIAFIAFRCAGSTAPAANAGYSNASAPVAPVPVQGGSAAALHRIVCTAGEFRNASFPINPGDSIVIGRDSSVSNIVIVAPKVSRKHCIITFNPAKNCYVVTDCSSNGTYGANGTRLMANMENMLPVGSEISLGSNDNRFRLE